MVSGTEPNDDSGEPLSPNHTGLTKKQLAAVIAGLVALSAVCLYFAVGEQAKAQRPQTRAEAQCVAVVVQAVNQAWASGSLASLDSLRLRYGSESREYRAATLLYAKAFRRPARGLTPTDQQLKPSDSRAKEQCSGAG